MAAVRSQFLRLLLLITLLCARCYAVPTTTCSTTCESSNCTNGYIRYGRYCGIFYSGCHNETACDGLDECCKTHDNCVDTYYYLSTKCNQALLDCVRAYQNSGQAPFPGNTCNVRDAENTIAITAVVGVLIGQAIGANNNSLQHGSSLPPI